MVVVYIVCVIFQSRNVNANFPDFWNFDPQPPHPPGWGGSKFFFWTVHDISRTFDFFDPLKFPLRPPLVGGGGGEFVFCIQRHNIPSFCRLCISSLGNNMAPWTTWRDFSGTAHDATLLIQVLWYGWGVVYTRWLSPNVTAAVLRRRRSRRNKGQAETNTDLFTAANPNTITYLQRTGWNFLLIYSCAWVSERNCREWESLAETGTLA